MLFDFKSQKKKGNITKDTTNIARKNEQMNINNEEELFTCHAKKAF